MVKTLTISQFCLNAADGMLIFVLNIIIIIIIIIIIYYYKTFIGYTKQVQRTEDSRA